MLNRINYENSNSNSCTQVLFQRQQQAVSRRISGSVRSEGEKRLEQGLLGLDALLLFVCSCLVPDTAGTARVWKSSKDKKDSRLPPTPAAAQQGIAIVFFVEKRYYQSKHH